MNYEKESQVEESTKLEVFKPKIGTNNLVILSEPEETKFTTDDGNTTEQIKMIVESEEKQFVWYVAKGKTYKSLYKQLMLLGSVENQLVGRKIQMIVNQGSDDKKVYTIPEAIDLIPKEASEEKVE